MSGHSKWATIKRQKGASDIKRGQTFTKLANAITISVRNGGISDPESNFKLRLAIEKARSVNMPKENIQRAIARGTGGGDGKGIEEVVYEGFAPGGVSVIVEAITDNPQRTTSEIKNFFRMVGGSFGQPGTVSYQFANKGRIIIKKNGKSYNEIFEKVAESGAEDIEEKGEEVFVYTNPSELSKVRDSLKTLGFQNVTTELIRKPMVLVSVQDETQREKIVDFLRKIEELDDVQKVYSNLG